MKILPFAVLTEKNLLGQTSAWLCLLKIVFPQDPTHPLWLVNNTENITYRGQEYTAVTFDIDVIAQDIKGTIPYIRLRVANQNRAFQGYIEAYSGGIGASVLMTFVSSAHLGEDFSSLELDLEVAGSGPHDSQWAMWALGPPNPLTKRFPPDIYMALTCRYVRTYKQTGNVECGYNGADPGDPHSDPCDGTYAACQLRNNLSRFGGCPGLQGGRLRVI